MTLRTVFGLMGLARFVMALHHPEIMFSGCDGQGSDLHGLYPDIAPALNGQDDLVDLRFRTLELRCDGTVPLIPDPAGYPVQTRCVDSPVTETDSLYTSIKNDMFYYTRSKYC